MLQRDALLTEFRFAKLAVAFVNSCDVLFKDISCDERVPRSAKGLSRSLADIYRVLKESKPYMEL